MGRVSTLYICCLSTHWQVENEECGGSVRIAKRARTMLDESGFGPDGGVRNALAPEQVTNEPG